MFRYKHNIYSHTSSKCLLIPKALPHATLLVYRHSKCFKHTPNKRNLFPLQTSLPFLLITFSATTKNDIYPLP